MGTEKFCLKWNDFESNISGAFKDIRDAKDFFDVTLACDDDQLQAHKVILSACSPFFRNILKRNPHQHPLLYLKGVKYSDLQSVLNFMYHGEVNVAQDELNSFLAVAEELRVKGLTQNNGSQSANTKSSSSSSHHQAPKSPTPSKSSRPLDRESAPPPKRPRPAPAPIAPPPPVHDDDDIQEVVPVKSEPRDTSSAVIANTSNDMYQAAPSNQQTLALAAEDDISYGADESYDDYGSYDQEGYDGQMMDPNMAGGADGNKEMTLEDLQAFARRDETTAKWVCGLCGIFSHLSKGNVINHIESKHFPGTIKHFCGICGHYCRTKNALQNHKTRIHKSSSSGSSNQLSLTFDS